MQWSVAAFEFLLNGGGRWSGGVAPSGFQGQSGQGVRVNQNVGGGRVPRPAIIAASGSGTVPCCTYLRADPGAVFRRSNSGISMEKIYTAGNVNNTVVELYSKLSNWCMMTKYFLNSTSERKIAWIGNFTEDRRSRFRHYKYAVVAAVYRLIKV